MTIGALRDHVAAAAGIGFDGRCGAHDFHRLGHRADLQLQIDALMRVHGHREFLGHRGLEAGGLGLQLVAADLDVEKCVAAVLVCGRGLHDSRGDVLQRDLAARHHGLRLVANHPRNRCGIELCEEQPREGNRTNTSTHKAKHSLHRTILKGWFARMVSN